MLDIHILCFQYVQKHWNQFLKKKHQNCLVLAKVLAKEEGNKVKNQEENQVEKLEERQLER